MSEERRAHAPLRKWIAWLALALVIYVLSIGPSAALLKDAPARGASMMAFRIFYAPLVVLGDIPAVDRVMGSYVAWWERLLKR